MRETIKYARVNTLPCGGLELVIQMSGGGASVAFSVDLTTPEVAERLRHFATTLERGEAQRAAKRLCPAPDLA